MRRTENNIAYDNLIIVVTNRILRVALSITLWPHYISCPAKDCLELGVNVIMRCNLLQLLSRRGIYLYRTRLYGEME